MDIQKIGFVGGGNMASSLIGGLIGNGYPADKITVSDLDADKVQYLADTFGVNIALGSAELASGSSILRSEEHTSELQSLTNLVCRLLLEKTTIQYIKNAPMI